LAPNLLVALQFFLLKVPYSGLVIAAVNIRTLPVDLN